MDSIPAAVHHDLTLPTTVTVAPSGDRVAFLADEFDPDEDERLTSLFVVPTDGSKPPHRLSRASQASSPKWGPSGDKLAFLATRDEDIERRVGRSDEVTTDQDSPSTDASEDKEEAGEDDGEETDDDDEPKPQLWVFDLSRGGDAMQFTDRDEGVTAFDWGPDGQQLVIAARDPTDAERDQLEQRRDDGPIEVERLQHKFDGKGWLDEVTSYLFVIDTESRTLRRLDEANDGGNGIFGSLSPAWGPTDRIAFTANHTDWPDDNYVNDVYTIAPDGTDRTKVTDGTLTCSNPEWSPNGNRIAFTGQDPENWYAPTDVYVADRSGDQFIAISEDIDRTIGYGGEPRWIDTEQLIGLFADEGRTRFVRLDATGGTERTFERQGAYERIRAFDQKGETVGCIVSTPTSGIDIQTLPVDALTADRETTDPRETVTALNGAVLDDLPTPTCQRLTFESADGTAVEGIAYLPADFNSSDPSERPLIIDIHGGPMSYDEPEFRFQDWFFTSRGYIVLKVNYRGSTSYGRTFCEQLKGAWGTADIDDLQAGVDEMIERGLADADRLFPTGFSQGGVNTGYLVTRDDRWAAAAAEHGVYDYRSCFGTDDSQNWWENDFGLPWEQPEKYEEHSSITDVGNVETPLLITAGEEDWRCPPTQAEQLYVSVRKQGVEAKLVIYQGEHHNVGDPDRIEHRLTELSEWFRKYDPKRETDDGDSETDSTAAED